MKIAVVGECYSANLGDGLIAECIESVLVEAGHEVELVDLAGRSGFTPPQFYTKTALRAAVTAVVPRTIRDRLQRVRKEALGNRPLASAYARGVADCDLVLIGGGQILADNNLDFPFRLRLLCQEALSAAVPYAFVACGVGNFGRRAVQWMVPYLGAAEAISVRDRYSKLRLERSFPDLRTDVSLLLDPAVCLASRSGDEASRATYQAGIGVIAKGKVEKYRSEVRRMSQKEYDRFWLQLATDASRVGRTVLVSNGEAVDNSYAKTLYDELRRMNVPVELSISSTPTELASAIGACDAFFGARLHGLIAALVQGRRVRAVRWDDKVRDVMDGFGCKIELADIENPDYESFRQWWCSERTEGKDSLSGPDLLALSEQFRRAFLKLVDSSVGAT